MKNSATILLAVFFLLAGCSKEATYFFSKPSGSYNQLQKPQKADKLNDQFLPVAPPGAPEPEPTTLLAAALPAGPVLPVAPAPAPAALRTTIGTANEVLPRTATVTPEVLQPAQQKPPVKKKAMVGKAETGFALSLFGIVSIALMLISPAFLYFSGLLTLLGIIFSIVGLLQVRASKGKLRGKVRAIVGLVLGVLGTALVVLLMTDKL